MEELFMDKIIIDGFDFWNMTAMKYWSHPKSYDIKKKKEESKRNGTFFRR